MGNAPDQSNANVYIKGKHFYHTHLRWIPSVGDLIEMESLEDSLTPGEQHHFKLKVVHVVHQLRDVSKKVEISLQHAEGAHWVDIYAEQVEFDFEKWTD